MPDQTNLDKAILRAHDPHPPTIKKEGVNIYQLCNLIKKKKELYADGSLKKSILFIFLSNTTTILHKHP